MALNSEHLRGRKAIVTGAAGGIGEKICLALADFGIDLVITGRNEQKLAALADMLRAKGVSVETCIGDLRDIGFLDSVLNTARAKFGGFDILINNAGIAQNDAFEDVTPEKFNAIMETNVRAPYFLCQRSIPDLEKSGLGTIINICSVVAHKGYPRQSVYACSKHALLGLSKSLANEVFKRGIRVHCISPGSVFTEMIALARPDLTSDGMILPEDIADIVRFLLIKRSTDAVIDEIEIHRSNKEPFA